MKKTKLNFLDRTISYFSPRTAYERAAWRDSLTRNYDSGRSGRLNSGWVVVNQPAEQTNQGYRDTIRARARDLERNSDIAESIIGALERNVVGTGIQLQAKVKKTDGTENEELNTQIEELWKNWCRARNCDISGRLSFSKMLRIAVRRIEVDGGILFVKNYTNSKTVPFVLQVREVDDIDYSMNVTTAPGNKRIINGIELDEYNKPTGYFLKTLTPDGLWTGQSKRIDAKRVIHLFDPIRPTQIREMSKLAITANRVRDVNEFVEAESVKARILACLSVFIKKMIPNGTLGRTGTTTDSASGYTQKTLAPGMIEQLSPGDEVQVVNPAGQASNAKEFIQTQQRLAGSGQGLSYEAIARDMSQVNYSSARQGLLEDQKTYKIWQQLLIDELCYEVYTEFLISAVLSGELNISDFWKNKANYMKHDWITSGWPWIDPLKEVKANETALNTGQTTLAQICASGGNDWRDMLKQRAKEQELAKELGLTLGDNKNADDSKEETSAGDTTDQNS